MSAVYADSSALLKLVREESGTRELQAWLSTKVQTHPHYRLVSSTLSVTEVTRAAKRWTPEAATRAGEVLRAITLIPLDYPLLQHAGLVEPPSLRSLDAIHIATALSLGREIEAVATYDDRLASACEAMGIRVESPA